MNKLKELQAKFRKKMGRLNEIRAMDKLTDDIREERDTLLAETEQLVKDIDHTKRTFHLEELDRNSTDGHPYRPDLNFGLDDSRRDSSPGIIRRAEDKKDFRSLWGHNDRSAYTWNDEENGATFWEAVFSGRHHPALTTRAMTEGIGSEGGFLVPTEYAEQVHNVSLENEIVMPRATVMPMTVNEKKIPGFEIGDHSSNLYGGFTASYSPEIGTLSQANPKTREISLSCKKLYGFLRFSNELFEDIPGSGEQIANICGKGLGWYRDKSFLKGTGAGQPLGILSSPCLIETSAEVGQAANTIVYENLLNMLSHLWMGSFRNSVWICHPSTITELGTLTIDVGTAGAHIPVMRESDGGFQILTRPVIFTEKTVSLGNKGDIMLADFSQYVIGLRQEMRIDFSPHLYFSTDELAARLIERHDGEPLWDEALTLEDGSTTVSPFVVLEAR